MKFTTILATMLAAIAAASPVADPEFLEKRAEPTPTTTVPVSTKSAPAATQTALRIAPGTVPAEVIAALNIYSEPDATTFLQHLDLTDNNCVYLPGFGGEFTWKKKADPTYHVHIYHSLNCKGQYEHMVHDRIYDIGAYFSIRAYKVV